MPQAGTLLEVHGMGAAPPSLAREGAPPCTRLLVYGDRNESSAGAPGAGPWASLASVG